MPKRLRGCTPGVNRHEINVSIRQPGNFRGYLFSRDQPPTDAEQYDYLCAVLAVLFSCAGSIVSAQTAHFSGSTPIDWVQTPLLVSAPGFPGGIAVDRSGNIYVANYGQVVLKNTPSGNNNYVRSSIGTGLGTVLAVAVDGSGNVYIADVQNQQVVEGTPSGSSYIQSVVASSTTTDSFIHGESR